MFTAAWKCMANECRVATMQEEGEKRERETQKVGVREEGSGQHRPGRGRSECYISGEESGKDREQSS